MPAGAIMSTGDNSRLEAPVTFKAYLMCGFAAFGGIFFGFDSGYISGVLGTNFAIHTFTGKPYPKPGQTAADAGFAFTSSQNSLIVSILSCGTFFGAIIAGDIADIIGRRGTVIAGCGIFTIGVILQVASSTIPLLVVGRLVAGFGVGFVTSIIILYMGEIAPRKVRGSIISGYQFCITIGIVLAACVVYGCENRMDSGSYRIPMAIQMLWALILGTGLFFLPESPRYFVKRGKIEQATKSLVRLRGQSADSEYVQAELAEIIANHEYELSVIPQGSWAASWLHCFSGSVFSAKSNVRRTILGTALQMFQQWTGVNFIFYYGTVFFQGLGTISNPFVTQIICNLVNCIVTPIAFYTIEKFGRRALLIWGAVGMVICQFVAASIGVTNKDNKNSSTSGEIAFICIFIAFFATTWGPAAWVVVGEIFPLPIRSRGVGLSTASNWLWNTIIAVINPYLIGVHYANLGSKIFYVFGSLCACSAIFAYFCVYELKGLSLEQIDRCIEETTPRQSAAWKPHSTFAADMGMDTFGVLEERVVAGDKGSER